MKSSVQYKVRRLISHTGEGRTAEILVRGDSRFWRVKRAQLVESHSLEIDVFDGRTLIVSPEDVVALTLNEEVEPCRTI